MQRAEHINHSRVKTNHDYDITDVVRFEKVDVGCFILRITIGGLMLIHGFNKLMTGTEQVDQILMSVGLPAFFSFGVFLGEVIGPVMMIIGWKVRIAAFLVAFNMFMAILLVHSSDFLKISPNGGWMLELNALYLLGAIAVFFLGSGRFSLSKGRGNLD